jgi:hypothetical protein
VRFEVLRYEADNKYIVREYVVRGPSEVAEEERLQELIW